MTWRSCFFRLSQEGDVDSASFQFVLFGLAAAAVSNFSRARIWRAAVLSVASCIFLALLARDARMLLPLAGFVLTGYLFLCLIERGYQRILPWSVVSVVFAYVWLKKYTFLPAPLLLQSTYLTLGLSYVFFRVLHLLIDTAAGEERQRIGFFRYLLYTLNFTTFISGPIQRYEEFAEDQFAPEPIANDIQVVGLQLERILRGFFKVNVLAMLLNTVRVDALARMAQPVMTSSRMLAGFEVATVYPFFLYANFSGYIDIVVALARLMRIRLPENFDRPFSAGSVIEFWNRWHITLSTWLKTYVFNPLLMALMRRVTSVKAEPLLAVVCFFVTFFLIGLWHGRTSEFIMFGVLTGGGMSVNRLWQIGLTRALGRNGYKTLAKRPIYKALGRGLNFAWFSFTLFWFWGNWQQIHLMFSALPWAIWLAIWVVVWMMLSAGLALWEELRAALLSIHTSTGPVLLSRYARVVYASVFGLVSLVVTILLNLAAPPIVYKAF
jgi:alginate O-acetyltransferase complex protein AlgI